MPMPKAVILGLILLILWVLSPAGFAGQNGTQGSGHQSSIQGNVISISTMKNEITLRIPEGDRTLMVERGTAKLSVLKEGTPVMLKLNEAGRVVEVHGVKMELNIAEQAGAKPDHPIAVDGATTTIDPGLIF